MVIPQRPCTESKIRHTPVKRAAQTASGVTETADHQRMIDVVTEIDAPDDINLSSTLIEVLAGYDQITPISTLADIQREIADALGDENDVYRQTIAQSVVTRMFEDERILGPLRRGGR
jgi:hypothetical protein